MGIRGGRKASGWGRFWFLSTEELGRESSEGCCLLSSRVTFELITGSDPGLGQVGVTRLGGLE